MKKIDINNKNSRKIFVLLLFFVSTNCLAQNFNWVHQDSIAYNIAHILYSNKIVNEEVITESPNLLSKKIQKSTTRMSILKTRTSLKPILSTGFNFYPISKDTFLNQKVRFYSFSFDPFNYENYILAIDTNYFIYLLKNFKIENLDEFTKDQIDFNEQSLKEFSCFIVKRLLHTPGLSSVLIDSNMIEKYILDFPMIKNINLSHDGSNLRFEIFSIDAYCWVYKNTIIITPKKECRFGQQVILQGEEQIFE